MPDNVKPALAGHWHFIGHIHASRRANRAITVKTLHVLTKLACLAFSGHPNSAVWLPTCGDLAPGRNIPVADLRRDSCISTYSAFTRNATLQKKKKKKKKKGWDEFDD